MMMITAFKVGTPICALGPTSHPSLRHGGGEQLASGIYKNANGTMYHLLSLIVLVAFGLSFLPRLAHGAVCIPPPLNLAATENARVEKGLCTELRRVCADNSELVTFDPVQLGNLTRTTPYGVVERWSGLWYVGG